MKAQTTAAPDETPREYPPISRSSKINLMLMKRTNRLAIAMFVGGILYKLISKLLA